MNRKLAPTNLGLPDPTASHADLGHYRLQRFAADQGRDGGKEDGEDGPAVSTLSRALGVNFSAMPFDNTFADPDAETGANVLFGGDERFEHLGADGGRNDHYRRW